MEQESESTTQTQESEKPGLQESVTQAPESEKPETKETETQESKPQLKPARIILRFMLKILC